MSVTNEMEVKFDSIAENEGFARVAVGAFFSQLNPTLEEVYDVKTAVSEAVTNAIIHGYEEKVHTVRIYCCIRREERIIEITVEDEGCGISNIEQAMEPLFTTKSELERSGMGFAFMEAFMDEVIVKSTVGVGTKVMMMKRVKEGSEVEESWIKQSR